MVESLRFLRVALLGREKIGTIPGLARTIFNHFFLHPLIHAATRITPMEMNMVGGKITQMENTVNAKMNIRIMAGSSSMVVPFS